MRINISNGPMTLVITNGSGECRGVEKKEEKREKKQGRNRENRGRKRDVWERFSPMDERARSVLRVT